MKRHASSSVIARIRPLLALALLVPLAACQGAAAGRSKRVSSAAVAQDPRATPLDVEHYALDLTLLPDVRRIEGSCRVHLRSAQESLARVELDFEGLETHGVFDESGRALPWTHVAGVLAIELEPPLTAAETRVLEVRYGGSPKKGLWFSGGAGGRPTQVFTQGECEDSRWWFPCQDVPSDRATSELRVTMPAAWTAVAAGELVETTESGGQETQIWRMGTPHPPYLVTLVAGDFVTKQDSWNGIPLTYLAPPAFEPWLANGFSVTPDVLGFLSEVTGLTYPYPKYSQACVENFPFGGMENISATTMTVEMLTDERGRRDYDPTGLIAHEAAHQWFGDLFTCRDWAHIWLNESFATYMALLYVERTKGIDDFRIQLRDAQESYLAEDVGEKRRAVVWNVYRDPMDLFGEQVYPGGAARLHLLRFWLGDEAFFRGLSTYVHENVGRSVVTDDFRRAMEKTSGRDLGGFFEQWILSPGFPELAVSWRFDEARQLVELEVEQKQTTRGGTPLAFRTPVDVEVHDRRGSTVHRIELEQRFQRFVFSAPERPTWVRFDKHGWIPKTIEERKEPDEWLALLGGDDDPNGRRDAAREIGEVAAITLDHEKHELFTTELVDRLRNDPVADVRVAAAKALGRAGGLGGRAWLMSAAEQDSAAKVRVAALEALATYGPDRDLARLADRVFDAGYSWKTMSAAAGLFCTATPHEAYEWLAKRLQMNSPHDRLREGLIAHLGGLDRREVPDDLARWARDPSAGSDARQAAVKQLAKHPKGGPHSGRVLAELLDTEDFHLRGAVLEALAGLDDRISQKALAAYYPESVFPQEKRVMEAALKKGY